MSERSARPGLGSRKSLIAIVAVVAFAIALVAVVGWALYQTATAEFFGRYHLLERRYVNLEDSAHEGIGCRACHETMPVANGVSLVADYYTSLVQTGKEPKYFDFQPPTREACLKCHEDEWAFDSEQTERIPHPAHQRVAQEERDCVSCHKWTAHFEKYLDKHKEMPFSGVCVAYGCHVGTKTSDQCYDCHHVLHESGEQWKTEHSSVVRVNGQNSCIESCHETSQCQQCHTTGERPEFEGQTIEIGMKAIEELHVRDDWTPKFHGKEALRNTENCLKCHVTEAECDECHLNRPAFHGSTETWIGRHAKSTKDLEDPGCLTCHEKAYCEDCHKQFEEME